MKRRHNKYINYLLDSIFLLDLALMLASGYILWFILPRGIGLHGDPKCDMQGLGMSGTYWGALGINRYGWIDIHNWAAVALLAIVLLHIVLHWSWVVEATKRAGSYIQRRVRKVTEMYFTAATLFILFVFESLSGFVLWLVLPRGAGDYNYMQIEVGRTFWGLQRNVWLDLHGWVAVTILAVIIIHLVLNWRWVAATSKNILKGVFGLFTKPSPKPPRKTGYGIALSTTKKPKTHLSRAGVYLAIIGVVSLLVFVLIFQEDWTQRYTAMIAIIPVSLVALLMIKRLPLAGGLLLAALGITALVLDILFSPHTPGEITGRGIGLTAVFVCMPLLASGILLTMTGIARFKSHR